MTGVSDKGEAFICEVSNPSIETAPLTEMFSVTLNAKTAK
jgi:hypothetical protein